MSVTRSTPKSDFAAPGERPDPGADRVGAQEGEPLAVLGEVGGERRGVLGLDQAGRTAGRSIPSAARIASASSFTSSSASYRLLVPARTAATSFFDVDATVVRNWVTGTIGTSAMAAAGASVGSAAAGVGVGADPVDGSATTDAVGAGLAVGAITPPPAEGDGLAPNPSSPPVTGRAMANASRPRTTRVGPLFTGRIVTEASADGCRRRPRRAEERPVRAGGRGVGKCGVMADPTGFEPAISSVTGWHVGPLHHGSRCGEGGA